MIENTESRRRTSLPAAFPDTVCGKREKTGMEPSKKRAVRLFVLVLVATIGQGSMVETFAHMRSPVFMSFARGIGGLVLGAGVGAVCMIFVDLWIKYVAPKLATGKK